MFDSRPEPLKFVDSAVLVVVTGNSIGIIEHSLLLNPSVPIFVCSKK